MTPSINEQMRAALKANLTVAGWTLDSDDFAGSYYFTNSAMPGIQVYATPYWEGSDDIEISVMDDEAECLDSEREELPADLFDVGRYASVMERFLTKSLPLILQRACR